MKLPAELEALRQFHGHLGPFVVAGYVAGALALEELGARRYFGMKVELHCPPQPPPSCLADGIQFSTGCTLGKRNIALEASDSVLIACQNTDDGRRLSLRLPDQTRDAFGEWIRELGEEQASLRVWQAGRELFEVGA
ncbi:MAG: formylmethanofuran dehydrogenase subunit E family protein [Armatimonadota bacterium]